MFWGLNLKANRKYSQTTEKSFHISQAALDGETSQGGAAQIFLNVENQRFLICTLRKEVCEQAMLDLNFSAGCKLSFQSVGNGNVSLAGYIIEDDLNDDDDDFMHGDEAESDLGSEVEMEADLRNALNAKKAKKEKVKGKKDQAVAEDEDEEEDDDDDDEDDDDENEDNDSEAEVDENDDEDDDDEDDDEEDEEDDSEDEEVQQPKAKQPKLEKKEKKQNGIAKNEVAVVTPEKKSKAEKKAEKKEQQQQQAQGKNKQQQPEKPQQKAGQERVLSGGVKVVDLRVGNGPEAKPGKRTQVYYEGRLLSNNKVFDSLKTGAGFKFNLGRGDVIKGWDVGVVGMKVGGKRRITCPAHMAYGARGSPPTIPPNSTLVFEVELKGVN